MQMIEARDRLEHHLAERGVLLADAPGGSREGAGGDARAAWEAFCAAAAESFDTPHDDDGEQLSVSDDVSADLLLFESGWQAARPENGLGWAGDGTEPTVYVLSFTRQFSLEGEDGEYWGMNAVSLTVECTGDPAAVTAQAQRWGYAGRRRDDVSDETYGDMKRWAGHVASWAARVERSRSFAALELLEPVRFFVDQSDI